MPTHFGLAGLQLALDPGDNRETLHTQVRLAKARFPWLRMVVLGELATYGWDKTRAEPLPGPTEDAYAALAAELDLWLVTGSLYERAGEAIYNTLSVINPAGAVVCRFRKLFPFRPYESGVAAGDQFVTFDVPEVGRFGVLICYDMWFPETVRELACRGAEVILHPTLTNTVDRDAELAICRASAATNQCYFIDVNSTGSLGVGRSVFVGPDGDVIHQAGVGQELITAELDLDRVRRSRERGLLGLCQTLKSYRDREVDFAARAGDPAYLDSLGPLETPR